MTIISELISATTIDEVKRIEAKYKAILPDSQKPRLEQLCRRTINRINPVKCLFCK